MLKKIDHIGIAVKDLDSAISVFSVITGNSEFRREEIPEMSLNLAEVFIGNVSLEFLEATSPSSPISRFIEKRGEGIHHICFEVADIEAVMKILKEKGYRLLDEKPGKGAHGSRIAFIHPRSACGVLIELCQREE